MMITREEAIRILHKLSERGIFCDELIDCIDEISKCIEAERDGMHIWGADDDWIELYIAHREDLITEEMRRKNEEIYKKYAFGISEFEAEGLEREATDDEKDPDSI